MGKAFIKWSYLFQAISGGAFVFSLYQAITEALSKNYILSIFNTASVSLNIWSFLSLRKSRNKLRKLMPPKFSKHEVCSCGASDWGTLVHEYGEVPVCRNCWYSWRGK